MTLKSKDAVKIITVRTTAFEKVCGLCKQLRLKIMKLKKNLKEAFLRNIFACTLEPCFPLIS